MSFPKPGITLALDFPIKPDKSFPLFERLADMTLEFGGRLYPAKDAAMTAPQFQAFYPAWEQFARFRDPLSLPASGSASPEINRVYDSNSNRMNGAANASHARSCPGSDLRDRRGHLPYLGLRRAQASSL